jgi:hypothetical protein
MRQGQGLPVDVTFALQQITQKVTVENKRCTRPS